MDIQQIMKQAQAMQKKMETLQAELATREAEGTAGGGLVKITVTGKSEMKKVLIDPELLKLEEKDVLQDLVIAAFNDAKSKIEGEFSSAMGGLASEFGLPPGFKLPGS